MVPVGYKWLKAVKHEKLNKVFLKFYRINPKRIRG